MQIVPKICYAVSENIYIAFSSFCVRAFVNGPSGTLYTYIEERGRARSTNALIYHKLK